MIAPVQQFQPDIVRRLRARATEIDRLTSLCESYKIQVQAGAIEIAALQARNEMLTKALESAGWKPIKDVPTRGKPAMLLYFPPHVSSSYQQSTLPAMYRTGHPDEYPNRPPSHFMLVEAPAIPLALQTASQGSAGGEVETIYADYSKLLSEAADLEARAIVAENKLAALSPAPTGKMAGCDVTEEMVNAGTDVHASRTFESPVGPDGYFAEVYRAMRAASGGDARAPLGWPD